MPPWPRIQMPMNPVSPFPAIICLLVAMGTSFLLVTRFGKPLTHDRYASLDGLRGYLAFFVFLHHSSIWYFYLRTGHWKVPPSNLYTHFGQSGVALFFMITGFLFFSKLIDGRTKDIDWGRLFVSRFMRLVPLYLFAMFLLLLLIVIVTHGILNEPLPKLLKDAIKWLGFTVLGGPDLNGYSSTYTIVAGVTWSLPYEWFFYFSLPLLALTIGVVPPPFYLALGAAAVFGLAIWHPQVHILLSFVGGIVAAFLVRSQSFRQIAASPLASLICIGCIAAAVTFYPTAYDSLPQLLLSAAFIIIACGNTLFGVLIARVSRTLGEMAYSIYLLHGIILFVTFHIILGTANAATLSPLAHWLTVAAITPVLIFGSFLTFRLIESPGMRSTKTLMAWMRSRLPIFAGRTVKSR